MRIASIKYLINNKLHAAFDGEHTRVKVRDLFDLHFLAKNYAEHFTPEFAKRLMEFSKDPDKLTHLYEVDANRNSILSKLMDLETIILEINTIATTLHNKYSQTL